MAEFWVYIPAPPLTVAGLGKWLSCSVLRFVSPPLSPEGCWIIDGQHPALRISWMRTLIIVSDFCG